MKAGISAPTLRDQLHLNCSPTGWTALRMDSKLPIYECFSNALNGRLEIRNHTETFLSISREEAVVSVGWRTSRLALNSNFLDGQIQHCAGGLVSRNGAKRQEIVFGSDGTCAVMDQVCFVDAIPRMTFQLLLEMAGLPAMPGMATRWVNVNVDHHDLVPLGLSRDIGYASPNKDLLLFSQDELPEDLGGYMALPAFLAAYQAARHREI